MHRLLLGRQLPVQQVHVSGHQLLGIIERPPAPARLLHHVLYGRKVRGDGLREAVHRPRLAERQQLLRVPLDGAQRLLAADLHQLSHQGGRAAGAVLAGLLDHVVHQRLVVRVLFVGLPGDDAVQLDAVVQSAVQVPALCPGLEQHRGLLPVHGQRLLLRLQPLLHGGVILRFRLLLRLDGRREAHRAQPVHPALPKHQLRAVQLPPPGLPLRQQLLLAAVQHAPHRRRHAAVRAVALRQHPAVYDVLRQLQLLLPRLALREIPFPVQQAVLQRLQLALHPRAELLRRFHEAVQQRQPPAAQLVAHRDARLALRRTAQRPALL
mmetsp:Transcript_38381/g.98122  ORF Transcript_38381/g.98122 Transcript_38381/m.98122 type:complete len:323 (-) Transcript_38381:463-1431(-)